MDYYRHMLNHFGWTWLECKRCKFHGKPRRHDKMPTKLARAFSKREIRKEIDSQ